MREFVRVLIAVGLTFLNACSQEKVVISGQKSSNLPKVLQSQILSYSSLDKEGLVTITIDGEVYITNDLGEHWKKMELSPKGAFVGGSFPKPTVGWLLTESGEIWWTQNAGKAWSKISEIIPKEQQSNFRNIQFIDSQHGWVTEQAAIWRTNDGGKTWKRNVFSENKETEFLSLTPYFIDSKNGWLSSTFGSIFSTKDGGQTWRHHIVDKFETVFRSIDFVDGEHGWICGIPGGVYKTEDAGRNWVRVKIIEPSRSDFIFSVDFINKNEGWAAGQIFNKTAAKYEGVVYRTNDAGNSWHQLPSIPGEQHFFHIFFVTSEQGWLVASDKVYRTFDGGENWQPSLSFEKK